MPLFETSIAIEFIGGPFDGFKQVIVCSPDDLAPTVAVPAQSPEAGVTRTPPRTLALYALDRSRSAWCFRHTGWAAIPQPPRRWTSVVAEWYRQISSAAACLLSRGMRVKSQSFLRFPGRVVQR